MCMCMYICVCICSKPLTTSYSCIYLPSLRVWMSHIHQEALWCRIYTVFYKTVHPLQRQNYHTRIMCVVQTLENRPTIRPRPYPQFCHWRPNDQPTYRVCAQITICTSTGHTSRGHLSRVPYYIPNLWSNNYANAHRPLNLPLKDTCMRNVAISEPLNKYSPI